MLYGRRLGASQVFIVDENFIGNKKHAKDLIESPRKETARQRGEDTGAGVGGRGWL